MAEKKVLIACLEGGDVHAIDRDGRCLLEINEAAAYDMLDEEDRAGLQPVRTIEFSSSAERDKYVATRGWIAGRAVDAVPGLIGELYGLVNRLESLFPGRRFTPDGHLVGSIGEVIAAHRYGLILLPNSSQGLDALAPGGRLVEIKATQGRSVGLREKPNHLIVLHLSSAGQASEVYNGPGEVAWDFAGAMQKRNGQRPISLSKLRLLMAQIPMNQRIPEHSEGNSFIGFRS